MMTRGGGWWSSLWSPWSPRPRLSHTLILLIFNLIRITKWILHETIRPTNEETAHDDNKLKCKIKIEDYAKDVEVEDGDNDEDENYTTLHYTTQ